jgi:hypothetical protein
MKKITLMIAVLLGATQMNAQKVKEADVPSAVKKTFAAHYSSVKEPKWEKEGANYEAEFDVDKIENSVLFDANGNLLETETAISVSQLPSPVSGYVDQKLKGQNIKEASKIVDAKGIITYEAKVGGVDYIFDERGNFIKKE